MTLDIHSLMEGLAESRPILRDEKKDFQISLARHIERSLGYIPRLEHPTFGGETKRQDIWIPEAETLIELKYPRSKLDTTHNNKRFILEEHSAGDQIRYDFLEDIKRLERAVKEGIYAKCGIAIMLTNDSLYWRPSPRGYPTIFDAFRIHEGAAISGIRAWAKNAGAGSIEGREDPIILAGSYTMRWHNYSDFPGEKNGKFRYLAVSVGD